MERKRYIPDIVAPRYQLRVGNLGRDHFVHVRCEACGRIALIAAAELGARFASERRLVDVARRLACARCPAGAPISWSIYKAER